VSNEPPAGSTLPGDYSEFRPVPPAYPASDFAPPLVRRKFQDRVWLHVLLLLLTVYTTYSTGLAYYVSFLSDFGRHRVALNQLSLWSGFWYAAPVLLILGAHEMGHYLMCRKYNVDASLPYFLPLPLGFSGTLGAVIRIREPFPTRTALFDIGVAGPIAGFVMLMPFLFWGLAHSKVVLTPPGMTGYAFGEPLFFKLASYLAFGSIPSNYSLNAHPMVFAAWFGMLATALNLLPFGQLDGGHIAFAAVGRLSTRISLLTAGVAIFMTFISLSWLLFTVLLLMMLLAIGPAHPPVLRDHEYIGRGREIVAVLAAVMLVVCFTPVPIELLK
jgi:membrane-associated protease RseP (regulator of RpoE activity)